MAESIRCNAKSSQTKKPCGSWAMPNGKCRKHGGTNKGAPENNQNAVKPGSLYSRHMTDDEQVDYDQVELGRVDDELRLQRVRLSRALKEEAASTGVLELDESIERVGGELALDEKKYKRRDYAHIIDRITGRIESLENRKSLLEIQAIELSLKQIELAEKSKEQHKQELGPVTEIKITVVGGQVANA